MLEQRPIQNLSNRLDAGRGSIHASHHKHYGQQPPRWAAVGEHKQVLPQQLLHVHAIRGKVHAKRQRGQVIDSRPMRRLSVKDKQAHWKCGRKRQETCRISHHRFVHAGSESAQKEHVLLSHKVANVHSNVRKNGQYQNPHTRPTAIIPLKPTRHARDHDRLTRQGGNKAANCRIRHNGQDPI